MCVCIYNIILVCVVQIVASAAADDSALPVNSSSSSSGSGSIVPGTISGANASGIRNLAFASFWTQLPLSMVSAGILIFSTMFSRGVSESEKKKKKKKKKKKTMEKKKKKNYTKLRSVYN